MAAELGEAANGGQVLLSHDAWLRLQGRMHEASFPVVEQLGFYKLAAWPVPLPVYQASPLPCLRPKHLEPIINIGLTPSDRSHTFSGAACNCLVELY